MTADREWSRAFCELIDLTVPLGGYAVLLSAYFDASEREGGVFSVAGFAFRRGKKAGRKWQGLWGDTVCHMTDLHTRKAGSAFQHWTPKEAGKRLKDSVTLINQHADYGVAVSCNLKEIRGLAPKTAAKGSERLLDGFRSAYATCCHLAMFSLGKMVRPNHPEARIAYFFETGDQNQAEAARFWDVAAANPPLKQNYLHFSHTVIDKKDCRLLEAADIFAWEWAKHRERRRNGLVMRPSLKTLLDPNRDGFHSEIDYASDTRRAFHLTEEPLKRYFDQVKDIVLS